jgi:hypothetical protein
MKRLAVMVSVVAVTLVATALPFLPGRYDALAVPLSGIARSFGMASLLLVPIGLVWLVYELRPTSHGERRGRVGFFFAILGAGSIAVLGVVVVAVMLSGAPVAVGVLTAWGLVLWRSGPRMLKWARRSRGRDIATPLALILVPAVLTSAQLALARPLTAFAWNQTMDGLAPLIADIERYRATNGHYPRSLFSEWMDYRPAVIGVRGYQYETSGDVFSLAVEVPTFSFDSREYLLYNPADTHVMASHDADLLLRTSAELVQYRGYYSARMLDRPHWTVLSFD